MVRMPKRAQVRMTRTAISPRLATSTERIGRGELMKRTVKSLHPVHGTRTGHRQLHRADREAKSEHVARVRRLDQAVVPQPRRAVVGIGLLVEHLAQLRLVRG